jgi:hypothetical protein
MTSLGLFFVGAVLFVNGLSLLGRIDAAAAAPINAFVGLLLVGVTAFLVVPVRDLGLAENRDVIVGAVGFLLFAFTYLWVALNNWTGANGTGLGWYCAWAAGVAAFLAIVNFARYDDPRFGMLWLLWTLLFSLFFCVLALGAGRLAWATGWVTVIEAFITTTIPGALLLLGEWTSLADAVAIGAGLLAIVVFAALLVRPPRAVAPPPVGDPDLPIGARA